MIFLPNSADKYFAALRLYIHLRIIKYGMTEKHYEQLKMLNLAEALFAAESTEPVDIFELSDNLIIASAALKLEYGLHIKAKISGSGAFRISRKSYTVLLMELLGGYQDCEIHLEKKSGGVLIKIQNGNMTRHIPPLIRAMNGYALRESFADNMVIYLPLDRCPAAPSEKNRPVHYITDPFSPVNIFLYKFIPRSR